MRESDVEKYLVLKAKKFGGEVRKVKWIGRRNAPDRAVAIKPIGPVLVEVKRPGKRPTRAQAREIMRLRDAGWTATWVNCEADVDQLVKAMATRYYDPILMRDV